MAKKSAKLVSKPKTRKAAEDPNMRPAKKSNVETPTEASGRNPYCETGVYEINRYEDAEIAAAVQKLEQKKDEKKKGKEGTQLTNAELALQKVMGSDIFTCMLDKSHGPYLTLNFKNHYTMKHFSVGRGYTKKKGATDADVQELHDIQSHLLDKITLVHKTAKENRERSVYITTATVAKECPQLAGQITTEDQLNHMSDNQLQCVIKYAKQLISRGQIVVGYEKGGFDDPKAFDMSTVGGYLGFERGKILSEEATLPWPFRLHRDQASPDLFQKWKAQRDLVYEKKKPRKLSVVAINGINFRIGDVMSCILDNEECEDGIQGRIMVYIESISISRVRKTAVWHGRDADYQSIEELDILVRSVEKVREKKAKPFRRLVRSAAQNEFAGYTGADDDDFGDDGDSGDDDDSGDGDDLGDDGGRKEDISQATASKILRRMARSKQIVDPEKEAEIRRLLEHLKQILAKDLAELERAKQKFSSSFVEAIIAHFESFVPKHVLDMKAVDFLDAMEKDEEEEEVANDVRTTISREKGKPQPFVSVMTPAGVKVKIPSIIRTRVTGTVLEPRPSRFEEVLFSLHGTPVLGAGSDVTHDGDAKVTKKTKIITQFLQQQAEAEMSPATRKIVQQLTSVLLSKAKKQESGMSGRIKK